MVKLCKRGEKHFKKLDLAQIPPFTYCLLVFIILYYFCSVFILFLHSNTALYDKICNCYGLVDLAEMSSEVPDILFEIAVTLIA